MTLREILKYLVAIIVVLCASIFVFKDSFIIKNKNNTYNMNVSESVDTDDVYKSDDDNVKWESDNKAVVIEEDNTIVAKESGEAKITARSNNKKVYEGFVKVLDDEDMSVDSHSVNLRVNQTKKITLNNSSSNNVETTVSSEELSKIYSGFEIKEEDIFETGNDSSVDNYDYDSSDPSVAVVDEDGNIESVSSGDAIITVSDDKGNEDYIHVVVEDEDLDLYANEYNLNVGESLQIEYNLNSVLYEDKDIVWSSSDENIVKVNNVGMVTAISGGTSYINVKVGDSIEKQVLINVLVNDVLPESLDVSMENVEMMVGDKVEVKGTVSPSNVTNKEISWYSENNSIVTVVDGVVYGSGVGETVVSATTVNGIRKEIKVVVKSRNVEVDSINFSTDSINMKVGDLETVVYNILPSNATNKNVKFYYDKNYIEVDADGNVKALKAGNTILTITSSNGKIDTVVINIEDVKSIDPKISIDKSSLDMNVGDKNYLGATISNSSDNDLVWSSSDNRVVKVSNDGYVEAVSSGSSVVSVYMRNNNSVKAICYVTVKEPVINVSSIKLNKNILDLKMGDSSVLIPTIKPSDATNKNIKWISSNAKVATVDNSGNVKAIGVGSAKITAISEANSNIFDVCEVTVKENIINVNKIVMSKSSLKLVEGENNKLSVKISPSNATNKKIKWTSSNTKVVTVDSNGNIKAVGVGSAKITAISEANPNIFDACEVTVKAKNIAVTKLVLSKKSLKLVEGNTGKLSVKISPSNATNKKVKWASSNTKVVKVDSNGKVKAVGAGSAVVSATSKSNSNVKAKCTVKVEKTNKEKFIKALDDMAKQVKKDGNWHYGGMNGTFDYVRKHGRRMDCATYISHALMEVGVINSKSRFYKPKSNTIRYIGSSESGMKKHLQYINGNGKKASTLIKEGKLQKGDIVLWYNMQHTNAYAGNNKWYDAGRWSATGARGGSHRFKTVGPVYISSLYNNGRVWRILRVKD